MEPSKPSAPSPQWSTTFRSVATRGTSLRWRTRSNQPGGTDATAGEGGSSFGASTEPDRGARGWPAGDRGAGGELRQRFIKLVEVQVRAVDDRQGVETRGGEARWRRSRD